MSLQPGRRVGIYDIVGSLGAGGMGEVYRARDTTLNRDVALKILPEGFSADPERVARFSREAQVLASLNHPHVAQIYGVTELPAAVPARPAPGIALVMEFVDGEDLAQRLTRGALPIDEALPIALQIAEALEAAHDRGVIHRDLKPANVKVTPEGTVKVLDFGLAKALDPASPEGSGADAALRNSPTVSLTSTGAGVILGTAAYMAPEQARGQGVDRRVDVWAFGALLFEMLAGRAAFTGDTISDVLASVLKHDLDWTTLPPGMPEPIVGLLQRCLTPDRRNRLRDIGEARIALTTYLGQSGPVRQVAAPPRRAARGAFVMAGVIVLAAAIVAAALLAWRRGADAERPLLRYVVHPAANTAIAVVSRPALSLSPDGRTLVFAASGEGPPRLYVQRRDDFEPRMLAGTEGATDPVFSPDGQSLVFSAANRLNVMRLDGAAIVLATLNDPRGASWADDRTIVYSPEAIGGLFEIPASGGTPRAITTLDESAGERTHRWPHVLPGGRYVLFTVGTGNSPDNYDASDIDAVDRQTGERRTVLKGASMARYVPTGHLAFARAGVLFAVGFDPETLAVTGTPVQVLQGLGGDTTTGAAHVAWAADGTLAFVSGDANGGGRRLVWADRRGQTQPVDLPASAGSTLYSDIRIAPDGSRFALVAGSSGLADIWVYHVERRTLTRLTFTGTNATPVWSADGRHVYYMSLQPAGRKATLLRVDAGGGAEPTELTTFDFRAYLKFVSRDATWIVVDRSLYAGGRTDVARIPLAPKVEPLVLAGTRADERGAAVSPDGRWVAYQSDESGAEEVYVRAADGTGGRWQISNAGGEEGMWAPNGRELYFRTGNRLMVVSVEAGPTFRAGSPAQLFDGVFDLRSDTSISYDVHPKGDRLLMVRLAAAGQGAGTVRMVLNWFTELRQRVPTR